MLAVPVQVQVDGPGVAVPTPLITSILNGHTLAAVELALPKTIK